MTSIAIMGSNPKNKMQAPFDDPDWKIWACSTHNAPPHQELPRVDEWFEVHVPHGDHTRPPEFLDWVRDLSTKIPVWMRDRQGFPDSKEYPEEELKARFGPFFFTSTIAHMLAKAIVDIEKSRPMWRRVWMLLGGKSADAIGLWGIMQASPNEWSYQRPGVQYFIQRAHDLGIKVVAPPEARLFRLPDNGW